MKKILLGLAAAAALGVSAEMKIATVNVADLVRLHPQHESNRTLLKTTDGDYKRKLDARQAGLKALADEGKQAQADLQNPMLAPAKKAEAQKKLEDVQQRFLAARGELEKEAQHFREELADLETRLLKLETEDIRKKIAEFAEKGGYDFVIDASMLGFAKASYDVTDEVLKIMNVDPAKRRELGQTDKKTAAK